MRETYETLVRQEWTGFRSRGRLIAMTAAMLVTALVGVLFAILISTRSVCSNGPVEIPCPADPVGPQGQAVNDTFYFAHQPLADNGSITVRMTSMTGTITYPPPNHDQIVSGLVPWAKAGVIIKDGTTQGSQYAALMVTASHGVRMQYDYTEDIAGSPGGVSQQAPRWLRLTRSGNTITGHESADGSQWTEVGTVQLPGLPQTVQIGLFAASPGDLTIKTVALGAGISESRFTQASAVFDNLKVEGAPAGDWQHGSVGQMGQTDWEKYHRPPGFVQANGTYTITGTGDIGPADSAGGHPMEESLMGLVVGLIIVLVVAVRFAAADRSRLTGRRLAAKAIVIGAVTFASGLVAAAVVTVLGPMIMSANNLTVVLVSVFTHVRVVVGVAALLAVAAVFALAIGVLVRRTWVGIVVAISTLVVPYLLATLPLLPDAVADWLLRLTPAAAFAVKQTIQEYPQVVAHYAPSAGYLPLPGWAGFAVLCGCTAVLFGLALRRLSGAVQR
ncbi:hypothetical protein JOF56_010821 [Kibdelosporangium banguiense]|uniref:DUF1349 domain-containing protein n=1 Tax=Kibdelosporangium banguiense TaxID=1365924 RepID=A0ABS4U1C5_9PSEU|nr:hypothetical protein [Kibdelosporangium banguiense]MBP2330436.1 hypothetical protein [Kibdelosporangium banguiense]